jgi:hypothetical protein
MDDSIVADSRETAGGARSVRCATAMAPVEE